MRDYIKDVKFEVGYFFDHTIRYPFNSFVKGIKNLVMYRKIIWNDRWWDYAFLDRLVKFKLEDMEKHWHMDTHYCFDWNEKLLLNRLTEILSEIENIEDNSDAPFKEQEQIVQELYQEFGRLLYDIREHNQYGCDGKLVNTTKTNGIQTLWD